MLLDIINIMQYKFYEIRVNHFSLETVAKK